MARLRCTKCGRDVIVHRFYVRYTAGGVHRIALGPKDEPLVCPFDQAVLVAAERAEDRHE